jgi:dipeptidyl aminopeptidase/acylaminoacyl peptidase
MKIRSILLQLSVFVIIAGCSQTKVVGTLTKDKSIYVTKANGKIEQVTYTGKDSDPLISPDRKVVYFVRQTGNMGEYENEGAEQLAIMKVDLKSLKEEKLTDTILFEDWKSAIELYEVTGFSLTQDGLFLCFITQKWTTSGVLVKLNTQTKKLTEISHGDKFELLKDGKYKDHIIVARSSIKSNVGRQWSNWLIDIDGKEIMEIGDEDAVTNFKLKQ